MKRIIIVGLIITCLLAITFLNNPNANFLLSQNNEPVYVTETQNFLGPNVLEFKESVKQDLIIIEVDE